MNVTLFWKRVLEMRFTWIIMIPAVGIPIAREIFGDTDIWGKYHVMTKPVCVSHSVMPDSLWPHGLQPTRLLCPWDFPGKNTGVGCHALLQGIFLTQGSNPSLLLAGRFFTFWATREAPTKAESEAIHLTSQGIPRKPPESIRRSAMCSLYLSEIAWHLDFGLLGSRTVS